MKNSKIPDFPRIEINNYISKLSGNIRVILKEKTLNSLITESVLIDISKKLNYRVASLRKYIRKNQYPLFFIKILNNLSSSDVFKLIEDNNLIFFSKWKRVKLPNKISIPTMTTTAPLAREINESNPVPENRRARRLRSPSCRPQMEQPAPESKGQARESLW